MTGRAAEQEAKRLGISLKTLKIIHLALCSGVIIFALFTYFQQESFEYGFEQDDVFAYIVPVFALMGYFIGKKLFQKLVSQINNKDALITKMGKYQAATLIKYALLEGPALLAFFAYFLKGNALYLSIGGFLLLYLMNERPKREKIVQQLPLTMEEKKTFKILQ